MQQRLMIRWRGRNRDPPLDGSGTGSFLLHYLSTNRVDSRGLRWIPVDSTAVNKRLTSNVLDHKLRVVSQLPRHGRTGSTPCASTNFKCFSINDLQSHIGIRRVRAGVVVGRRGESRRCSPRWAPSPAYVRRLRDQLISRGTDRRFCCRDRAGLEAPARVRLYGAG